MNIHFVGGEAHRSNFEKLAQKFPQVANNGEYRAAAYVAAYPEVFRHMILDRQEDGPLDWYFDSVYEGDGEDQGEPSGNIYSLSEGALILVQLAAGLWDGGHKALNVANLACLNGDLYLVALRAIDLRRRVPMFAGKATVPGEE